MPSIVVPIKCASKKGVPAVTVLVDITLMGPVIVPMVPVVVLNDEGPVKVIRVVGADATIDPQLHVRLAIELILPRVATPPISSVKDGVPVPVRET